MIAKQKLPFNGVGGEIAKFRKWCHFLNPSLCLSLINMHMFRIRIFIDTILHFYEYFIIKI